MAPRIKTPRRRPAAAVRHSSAKKKARSVAADRGETFQQAVSLGSFCLPARFLEAAGIRDCKLPFDWSFSSAYMVRHCLCDDFKVFLDRKKHVRRRSETDARKWAKGTGHSFYGKFLLSARQVLWPHHDLCNKAGEDYLSLQRSVQRFRGLLKAEGPNRTLFILAQEVTSTEALAAVREEGPKQLPPAAKPPTPDDVGPQLGSILRVRCLFRELCNRMEGAFRLDAVYIVAPPASEAERCPASSTRYTEQRRDSTLHVHELHCIGTNTGLFFKNKNDKLTLHKMLLDRKHFDLVSLDDSLPQGIVSFGGAGSAPIPGMAEKARSSSKPPAQKSSGKRVFANGWQGPRVIKGGNRALEDRRLTVQQENPKKEGGDAYHRYEKYKKAKTVKQFFKLGGWTGDLKFDTARGWIQMR